MSKRIINIKNAAMNSLPLSVNLITSTTKDNIPNIITITYITAVNEEPPMFGIAIRPQKYSCNLIKSLKEFVINIPTTDLLAEIDFCGSYSGQKVNKFIETVLTPVKAKKVNPPLIKECPINLECIVREIIKLPSHTLFIGEAVEMSVDEKFVKDGDIDFDKIQFLFTTYLDYRIIGQKVGTAFKEHIKKYPK